MSRLNIGNEHVTHGIAKYFLKKCFAKISEEKIAIFCHKSERFVMRNFPLKLLEKKFQNPTLTIDSATFGGRYVSCISQNITSQIKVLFCNPAQSGDDMICPLS
jgi:hypothetical protein